jgi:hypothetical protein
MAYNPGANGAFQSGVNHTVNTGRGNDNSVTLDGALQADSDRWDHLTPHGVLRAAMSGSQADDGSFEQFQRNQGGYGPGQFTTMQDQVSQGSDDIS